MPYKKSELYCSSKQRTYTETDKEVKFLLGGIGTGNISVGSRGNLCDFEIFNSPAKGNKPPYSFFAIRVKEEDKTPVVKVLEANIQPPYETPWGLASEWNAGAPHFAHAKMQVEYPFVNIKFTDKSMPLSVSMEAFTPFIPLDADNSGIPAAVIRYKVKNPTKKPIEATVVGSLPNIINGIPKIGEAEWRKNEFVQKDGISAISYKADISVTDQRYGTMALMTKDQNVTPQPRWYIGRWFDSIHYFWNDLVTDGKLDLDPVYKAIEGEMDVNYAHKIGSLGIYDTIQPGEERVFEFIISWNFPNRKKCWDGQCDCSVKNYYSTLFKDALDAGIYLKTNLKKLEEQSRTFSKALYGSTLPGYVIDALASNITVLRSNTCFRIEDGTLLGWEGCHPDCGCCAGTCTHVWNYAQTLSFLFPELEKTMRRVEFNLETNDEGNMAFRTQQVLGQPRHQMLPAADGQMGTIVRLYREWKLTGDDEFLRSVWKKAKSALEFAFTYWDADGDGVFDSRQHNTYDIEFYGPCSLTNSIFFAALKASAEMAQYLGDEAAYEKYSALLKKGSGKMDEMLWGGEYYVQNIDDVNKYKYQYGKGCLADQLLGQQLAHVVGLSYILPQEHVKKAVESIFKYNFRESFYHHTNLQRTYALNDDKGLLLCTWPNGGRPNFPFVYCDEVWTGFEYQVASHLIFEGYIEEGLTVVKAARDRHDGIRRNPFNEAECGNHYARSMSSWAVNIALTGFGFDMTKGKVSFKPVINQENFRCFWSTGKGWGVYTQKKDKKSGKVKRQLKVLYGDKNIKLV